MGAEREREREKVLCVVKKEMNEMKWGRGNGGVILLLRGK
jgi:hypothetical protein